MLTCTPTRVDGGNADGFMCIQTEKQSSPGAVSTVHSSRERFVLVLKEILSLFGDTALFGERIREVILRVCCKHTNTPATCCVYQNTHADQHSTFQAHSQNTFLLLLQLMQITTAVLEHFDNNIA